MRRKDAAISREEIRQSFDGPWGERFGPILSVPQFAELFGESPHTVRDWFRQGRFGAAARKIGKHIRIFRDRAIVELFKENG